MILHRHKELYIHATVPYLCVKFKHKIFLKGVDYNDLITMYIYNLNIQNFC